MSGAVLCRSAYSVLITRPSVLILHVADTRERGLKAGGRWLGRRAAGIGPQSGLPDQAAVEHGRVIGRALARHPDAGGVLERGLIQDVAGPTSQGLPPIARARLVAPAYARPI